MVRRTTTCVAAAQPGRGCGPAARPVAWILVGSGLLVATAARAGTGATPSVWPAFAGPAVGIVVAVAAIFLAYQVQRLLRAIVRPAGPGGAGEPSGGGQSTKPVRLPGVLAKLDGAERLNARQFGLQRSQFELFKRMRGDLDPASLATAVLEYTGRYYEASVGVFYLARPDQSLEPAATYGLAPGVAPARSVPLGEGIVGRAAVQGRIAVLEEVAEGHLDLATGLGRSSPRSVIVAPLHCAGHVLGAMELGVAGPVRDEDLDFLRSSAESVAMALDSALARAREQRLLKETRRQAEVLAQRRRELQQKNAELERADRYKNEFLANMSHELRTPLNSMLIMSQVLAENQAGNLSSEQVETALTINKAGNELLLIINDILDMSRVEAGRLEVHPVQTDLRQVLRGLEDLFRPVAERRGLRLRSTCEPEVPWAVVTDPLRVSQILKNLLDNAFKFTAEGGIEVRLRRAEDAEVADLSGQTADWVALAVSDTGIGMDEETATHVFGVFQQGDGSIARRYGGSGLGLSISRSLAGLLGGDIHVASVAGGGSTFTLLLPRRPAGVKETATSAAAHPASAEEGEPAVAVHRVSTDPEPPAGPEVLAGRRVLLVDADMRTVYELSSLLDGLAAAVAVARSGPAALEQIQGGGPWDLLVVDRALLAGHEALGQAVAALAADVVVLDGTGNDAPTIPDRPCLAKPVVADEFVRLCRDLVGEAVAVGPAPAHQRGKDPTP